MMIGAPRSIDESSIGLRFLLGKPTWAGLVDQRKWLNSAWVAATHLFTVESIGVREMWARDQNGEIRRFELSCHLGQGEIAGADRGNLMWMGALPNGTYEEIAAFADALVSERSGQHPFAFFVRKITPAAITVNLVCLANSAGEYLTDDAVEKQGRLIGNAFVGNDFLMDPGDHDWSEASFVVAKGCSVRHDGNGKLVAEAGAIVPILAQTSIEAIAAWLPDMEQGADKRQFCRRHTPLGTVFDFIREGDRGIARSEPDRALFYWYPVQDDADDGSTSCANLGSEGHAFFDVDSLTDYFYGENLDHGLWMLENAKWWTDHSCGDYDCGIEGDWRRATIADIEHFGFTIESLNGEIASIRDRDIDPELAQMLIMITDETDVELALEGLANA